MKCLNCGKEFTERTVVQKYCCPHCKNQHYYRLRKRGVEHIEYPSITFQCAQCGKTVVTDGISDKRTRFCCESCERKFWRHPHWERESSLTNFHSAEEYGNYERRTNEQEAGLERLSERN